MRFALFDFFESGEVDVGETDWIIGIDAHDFVITFDKRKVVQVAWPSSHQARNSESTKKMKLQSTTYPAKVLHLSGACLLVLCHCLS